MSIRINEERCARCGACVDVCPGNLIKRDTNGKARIKRPADCWGCASCLKECRFQAIEYFLGADLGGAGAFMQVERRGDVARWIVRRNDRTLAVVDVDRSNANKY